jgi:hypothetical protein
MSTDIYITGNFDGGNPKDPNSIFQSASDIFTIVPFSEDEDPNYKFRLDVRVKNLSTEVKTVKFAINWQEPKFNHLRDYVYLKHQGKSNWRYIPLSVNSKQSYGEVEIAPGVTYLSLHPSYNYSDYQRLMTRIPDNSHVHKKVLGETEQGRQITMLHFSGRRNTTRKKIFMVSRIHPYETAGSFCAEGIVEDYLTGGDQLANLLNNNTDVYLIPMANPDGVFNGFCKRTGLNGLDIAKTLDFNDLAAAAIKKGVDAAQPNIYCEFHNWMFKDLDGIYYLNRFQAWKFKSKFPSQKPYDKKWRSFLRFFIKRIPPVGFKKYCSEKFNSSSLTLEFPWFNRSVEDMKKIGVQTVTALIKTF